MAFRHNSRVAENEPSWGSVNKTKLPPQAFAYVGDPKKKSTWGFPHHWVRGGRSLDENGVWKDGELLLHRGGLNAAWAAAMGARTGQRASPQVIAHLREHRRALEQRSSRLLDLLCRPDALSIECAEGEQDQGEKLPRFHIVAYTGEPMRLSGWFRPVVIDLAGLTIPRQSAAVRFNHDPARGVGHTTRVAIEDGKLVAEGVISRDTAEAGEIVRSARRGFPWQASIGATVEEYEYVRENQTAKVNGRELSGPINVVRRAVLGEISFVDVGADRKTSAAVAAHPKPREEEQDMNEELKQWLAAQGIDQVDWSDEHLEALEKLRNQLEAGPAPQDGDTPDAVKPVDLKLAAKQLREAAAQEAERIAAVRKVTGDYPEIEAQAIKEGWSAERAELEVLRVSRPSGPAIHATRDLSGNPQVIEAALCMQAAVPVGERDYQPQVLEAAERYRKRGLRWCVERIAAAHGQTIDADPGTTDWVRAAFSLNTIVGITGNVANKALQRAFAAAPAVAPRIAARRSHTNFHAHTVYSLALNGELSEVGPDGQLKHLTLGEESRTRQVSTRGALLSITRQDLINDDLGAFADLAAGLGRKAVTAREKAVFTLLNGTGAGASFFTTAHNNYFDGASSNLQSSSLADAVKLFRDQVDPGGDPLLIEPRILLVPSTLEVTARELMNSEFILGPTSSKTPARNIWRGAFDVQVSSWLNNASVSGSDTAWYLFADPNDVAVVEIAYLNGQEQPTVEHFGLDADPTVLGVTWRVYYDFGAALAEWRAGVKSKGAA